MLQVIYPEYKFPFISVIVDTMGAITLLLQVLWELYYCYCRSYGSYTFVIVGAIGAILLLL